MLWLISGRQPCSKTADRHTVYGAAALRSSRDSDCVFSGTAIF
ncbi:hypothetical protein [Paenibacillus sp. UNC499MF]|nr:hypothetical protein [Paenibacillus sp. UNC499MF]